MYKSKSIDFDFFETDEKVELHGSVEEHDCLKIITTAVIETNPLNKVDFPKSTKQSPSSLKEKYATIREQPLDNRSTNSLSSSTSSIEKRLLEELSLEESLSNCLAYNDDLCENRDFISSLGEKECSETSLSDSTFTTITSDFTSVSPMSSTSHSCSVYDGNDISPNYSNKDDNNENSNDECTEIIQVNLDVFESEQCSQEDHRATDKSTDSNSDFDDCYGNLSCGDEKENIEDCKYNSISEEVSRPTSELKKELRDNSIESHSSPILLSIKTPLFKGPSKIRSKKRESNLTFSREELIKIERDNLILLKKIMAYSKPRTLSLHKSFGHKKTTAAINRARQQKKIEQDNYILYNKISALGQMKKVF